MKKSKSKDKPTIIKTVLVFIEHFGLIWDKRYYYIPSCKNKNSYPISLDEAKAAGLTPCQKCAN